MDAPAIQSDSPPPEHVGPRRGRFSLFARAFSHRNYRLFFGGQSISLVGTFLTQVAIVWLVYHITGSALLLGVAGFAGQIPMFLLAPFGGVWVDRWNRQRMLVITQSLSMLQSFGLGIAAMMLGAHGENGDAVVTALICLAACQGFINAFDMPGRQAFLVEMVDRREDLANAIALNSTMVHAARLVGPAIGGLLIHYVGPALCFFIDGSSYVAVIAALLMMNVKPRPPREIAMSVMHDLREGLAYIWASAPIRVLLILMALLSLTGMPALSILMPIFAREFGGVGNSDEMLGFLMGASGLGALIGALYLASRKSVLGLGRLIAIAAGVFGGAIIAFALSRHLWLSLLIVPAAGFGMLISFASTNTLLQTLTADRMRGRVMSFFAMAFVGMAPWGNLIAGISAKYLGGGVRGASITLLWSGSAVLVAAFTYAAFLPRLRKHIRPIYVRQGILPQPVAEGLQTATEAVSGAE
ncbi:MAG TPA: MFS transporter [Tepidisphaeraceae bacterium]|nr:MFS transporter [Tepidisphaeraceae bacterium]